jgi:hypothetical protein
MSANAGHSPLLLLGDLAQDNFPISGTLQAWVGGTYVRHVLGLEICRWGLALQASSSDTIQAAIDLLSFRRAELPSGVIKRDAKSPMKLEGLMEESSNW